MQQLQTRLQESAPKLSKTKFREHSSKYAGKTQLEYRDCVTTLERDHQYYPDTFDRDEEKEHDSRGL